MTDSSTPPRLRPGYRVATFESYAGLRFVAHDLSEAQAEMLRQAAKAAGIPEQR